VTTNARSGRRALLFRGDRWRDGQGPERLGELSGIEASACGGPVLGSKLDVAVARPERHDANDLGWMRLGIETVELTRDDEREEVRSRSRVVVGAEGEPCLSTGADRRSESTLAVAVRERQPAVLEEAAERLLMPNG
jgi:hypothetical protein